jgi:hypothetical protein
MNLIPEAQHLILFAIAVIGGAAAYVLAHTPIDRSLSVSLHVAQARRSIWLFAAASVVSAIALAVFMFGWFIPALEMPLLFTLLLGAALICQLLSAFIPHVTGWKGRAHELLAYSMAYVLPVILVFLLFTPKLSATPKVMIGLLIVWMVSAVIRVQVQPASKQKFLLYQTAYLICFWMALLIATYIP